MEQQEAVRNTSTQAKRVYSMSAKILVVEDDEKILSVLEVNLKLQGYHYQIVKDGKQGLQLALTGSYDLLVLDLELPSMNGLEVCERIRESNKALPILMLTGRAEELDRVTGLEVGADDYLCKPFSVAEFVARVRAMLRRATVGSEKEKSSVPEVLRIGELVIDAVGRKVSVGGELKELTALEFDLLFFLASHPGRSFSRSEILQEVWDVGAEGYENNVNAVVVRVRRAIEPDPATPKYIQTVWGIGYRFAEASEFL